MTLSQLILPTISKLERKTTFTKYNVVCLGVLCFLFRNKEQRGYLFIIHLPDAYIKRVHGFLSIFGVLLILTASSQHCWDTSGAGGAYPVHLLTRAVISTAYTVLTNSI